MLFLLSADFQKIFQEYCQCQIAWIHIGTDRPPDKSALQKIIFLIS